MPISKRFIAELFGTFWLVLGGCGSAVLAAGFPHIGIGFVGVSLAFGLTVLTMANSIGHISGCHLNPAVTIGLWAGKRFPAKDIAPYVVAQVAGALIAAAVLYVVASGKTGFVLGPHGFAVNGYGSQSPDGYNLTSALVTEIVLTFGFLMGILGPTNTRALEIRTDCCRYDAAPYSSDQYPGDKHVSQSSPQHRSCPARWRCRSPATLAVLVCTCGWGVPGRSGVSRSCR